MYRLAVETLVGLRLEVDRLRVAPRVPADWTSFKVHYRYRETFHHLTFRRVEGEAAGVDDEQPPIGFARQLDSILRIVVDGVELTQSGGAEGTVPLVNDGRDHYIEVEFGRRPAQMPPI
jgi:cellobiose phosphorylase